MSIWDKFFRKLTNEKYQNKDGDAECKIKSNEKPKEAQSPLPNVASTTNDKVSNTYKTSFCEESEKRWRTILPDDCKWEVVGEGRVTWRYRNGCFNPWVMKERLKLYLAHECIKINADLTEGLFDTYVEELLLEVEYQAILYRIHFPLKTPIIWLGGSSREDIPASLLVMIDSFFLNGYEPDNNDEFETFVKRYTPVEFKSKSEFSGYHDEDDLIMILYNANNKIIARLRERDYGNTFIGRLTNELLSGTAAIRPN